MRMIGAIALSMALGAHPAKGGGATGPSDRTAMSPQAPPPARSPAPPNRKPSRAPADRSRIDGGKWYARAAPPRVTVPELSRHEEPAPGRSDHPGNVIAGYCPPRAQVFPLPDGRALVTREPCSGTTHVALRGPSGEQRISGVNIYGGVGVWHVLPLARELVVMVSAGSNTPNILVVDLAALRAEYLHLPPELQNTLGLQVGVAGNEIVAWGGANQIAVGSGGCENPPPGVGCDPYVLTRGVPNEKVMAFRPR